MSLQDWKYVADIAFCVVASVSIVFVSAYSIYAIRSIKNR